MRKKKNLNLCELLTIEKLGRIKSLVNLWGEEPVEQPGCGSRAGCRFILTHTQNKRKAQAVHSAKLC
jgi:hypothetical protein